MIRTKENGPLARPAGNVIFLGFQPTNFSKQTQAQRIADDPVMQRAVTRICDQGPRMVLELLSILAESNIRAYAVEKEIKRFALLPPGALHKIGCDQIRRFEPLEVPQ